MRKSESVDLSLTLVDKLSTPLDLLLTFGNWMFFFLEWATNKQTRNNSKIEAWLILS